MSTASFQLRDFTLAAARKNLGVYAPERRTSTERKAQLLEQYFPDLPKTCNRCGCIDSIRQLRFAPGGTARATPLKIYWNFKTPLPSVAQARASTIEYP